MKKLKAPRLVTVAAFTTATVIFWVFYSIYEILTSDPPLDMPPEILAPISPELDTNTLEGLETKLFFEDGAKIVISSPAPSVTTPTPTTFQEVPSATDSATTPAATESADLSPTPTVSTE